MSYNLVPTNILISEEGFKLLTEAQLAELSDGTTLSGGPTIIAGETLSIVCDLKTGFNLDDAHYYRTAAASESITIYARQNEFDTWDIIPQSVSGAVVSASLSGTTDRYRFLKVEHGVNSGSAVAHELEVFTSDEEVLFGSQEQGNITSYDMGAGVEDIVPQLVFIKNPDSITQDFYALLDAEAQGAFSLEISSSIDGPYYKIYENAKEQPIGYPWAQGVFTNTEVSSGNVVTLTSGSSVGTYYTPILDLQNIDGRRFFWQATVSGTSEIDNTSFISNVPTVSVRFSDTTPESPWTDGQVSNDPNWSVVSGTLSFEEFSNNTILGQLYKRYFQAKIEFSGDDDVPALQSIGIESGIKVTISGGQAVPIYARVVDSSVPPGVAAAILSWYFDSRILEN